MYYAVFCKIIMSKIVYKDRNTVVINKSVGVSSQPDNTQGNDALTASARELMQNGEPTVLFPVHRLDKVVSGLLVFARNKQSAARLSSMAANGELNKEYLAVVEGKPSGTVMKDHLLKNSAMGKSTVCDPSKSGAKYAELQFEVLDTAVTEKGEKSLVKIKLETGRFHQIRAQFSSRSHPLVGDKKYGSTDHRAKSPSLFAFKLEIPAKEGSMTLKEMPEIAAYPWNLFRKELYENV